jgi:type III secretion protein L
MTIGKVIKGNVSPEPSNDVSHSSPRPPRLGGVLDSEVYEAHQSAHRIVEAARKQGQEILDAAEEEKRRILSEAKETGRQEGLALVSDQLLRAKLAHGELLAGSEREIVAIALKVAEKILGADLERDPSLVVEICAKAIESIRAAHQMIVRVNPKDAIILREQRSRLMELIGRVKEIAIKEDSDVPRHGCVIETDIGVIDAQLATQIEMLRRVLLSDTAKAEGQA